MNDEDLVGFLALRIPGNGQLTVYTPDNRSFVFPDLDLDYIAGICPLLAYSFEGGPQGRKLHSLNASSVELVSRFLRFLYAGNYHVLDHQGLELPCSLLMHAQLYHYGELYDVHLLMDSAYLHISQICEMACSMPTSPKDLCDALRYLYLNVKDGKEVHDTILHYCMNCFVYHRLSANEEFLKLVVEVKAFEQDIFRINMERGFSDEGSSDIIQMQLPNVSRKEERNFDYLYDMFGSNNSTPMQTPLLSPVTPSPTPSFTLIHRPRQPGKMPVTADSDGYSSEGSQSSDFENFSLVGRPRPSATSEVEHDHIQVINQALSIAPSQDVSEETAHSNHDDNPHNSFNDGKRFGRPLHKQSPMSQREGLWRSVIPSEASEEVSNPFDDPTDADESDSEWSVVSDQSSPRVATNFAEQPVRSRSLYSRLDLAGSTETVIAVSDKEDSPADTTAQPVDSDISDSEWSHCSDEGLVPAPT